MKRASFRKDWGAHGKECAGWREKDKRRERNKKILYSGTHLPTRSRVGGKGKGVEHPAREGL